MIQLTLTSEEAETLREALLTHVSELRMEVADTDAHDFREELKRKEALLRGILERLPA